MKAVGTCTRAPGRFADYDGLDGHRVYETLTWVGDEFVTVRKPVWTPQVRPNLLTPHLDEDIRRLVATLPERNDFEDVIYAPGTPFKRVQLKVEWKEEEMDSGAVFRPEGTITLVVPPHAVHQKQTLFSYVVDKWSDWIDEAMEGLEEGDDYPAEVNDQQLMTVELIEVMGEAEQE